MTDGTMFSGLRGADVFVQLDHDDAGNPAFSVMATRRGGDEVEVIVTVRPAPGLHIDTLEQAATARIAMMSAIDVDTSLAESGAWNLLDHMTSLREAGNA